MEPLSRRTFLAHRIAVAGPPLCPRALRPPHKHGLRDFELSQNFMQIPARGVQASFLLWFLLLTPPCERGSTAMTRAIAPKAFNCSDQRYAGRRQPGISTSTCEDAVDPTADSEWKHPLRINGVFA